ncbi:DUF2842 domain-containing protein [Defluviimonas sp. WL0024]|uniref:DUF2842 domain-containing protein n=2 Tax=Albidovulum TaxID=205889 RepID=A0ABT3J2J9_9RHOB|nr:MULTISPECIES: DUF2842 domain-containing protein [Defluviimonas]MCU9847662.1 DUF2842 domain-containing protein [Defluviimonas sp. WL0024]MCW3781910.1 DUF2842 domain-containing protein [Defluviimonas salinarum]
MLSYRTRRRLALLILLVGLPVYIVVAVSLINMLDAAFGRQPFWVEMLIYLGLGFLWMLPFRFVFRGVGKADPEAGNETER